MYLCEGQKWDLEHEVRKRDWEVLPIELSKNKFCIKNKQSKIFTKDLICLRHEKTKHNKNLFTFFITNHITLFCF
jgi:hypothetical protein